MMTNRINIFTKIVVLMLALLIPVIILFTISNIVSVKVIQNELKTINLNKLRFLHQQIKDKIDQISINAITLANDPAIKELDFEQRSGKFENRYELKRMILEHITLQSGITGWHTNITVYSRLTHEVISTSKKTFDFDDENLVREIRKEWQFKNEDFGDGDAPYFIWYSVTPASAYKDPESARLIVQVSFATSYLQDMLDQYKLNGEGDPFLYHPTYGIITNRTPQKSHTGELARYLDNNVQQPEKTNFTVELNGKQYLMSYIQLPNLEWYLVDYIPMEEMLSPVTQSRNLFYISTFLLLLISILASYLLYRNIQVPIRELIRHMRRIQRGDYSARIEFARGSEFSFLFQRFNEMAKQIQDLMEKVYAERLRSREAVLKQLQSQINPHFLYNCLFYIKNMARLGDEESVVAMALNLGEYFRYTTRLGKQTTMLHEELGVIENYLNIQNLRMKRINYQIEIPEGMKQLVIPRLILQPVVENAVIHGIEPKDGQGEISISGELSDLEYRIFVEDNGVGMKDENLRDLQKAIEQSKNEDDMSYGLWNVNQRLKLTFGEDSGLFLSHGSAAGIRATVVFRRKDGETDVSTVDRR